MVLNNSRSEWVDAMDKETIGVFVEPIYITPVWFTKSIAGIEDAAARHRVNVAFYDQPGDLGRLPQSLDSAIIVSIRTDWTQQMVYALKKNHVKPILAGMAPGKFGEEVSGPLLNRRSIVENMVHYFYSCQRRRLALVGSNPNSNNDQIRCQAFLSATQFLGLEVTAADIYSAATDLDAAIELFFARLDARRYNGVICTNDYVAGCLLERARQHQVAVPDRLYVAGSGNMLLGCCSSPTLTSSTLNYYEMGAQSVTIWDLLRKNPALTAIAMTLPGELIYRGSTAFMPPPPPINFTDQSAPPQAESPGGPTTHPIRKFENCLIQCDALDFKIINGVRQGSTYENLANDLYVSEGTIRYRLKKLFAATGVANRAEFVGILHKYATNANMLDELLTR
jgi:DNA-binding LacI/PurR family transcriptional regulator/DNA-binding CsgD family transcriptional regulator